MSLINQMLQDLEQRGQQGSKDNAEPVARYVQFGTTTPASGHLRTKTMFGVLCLALAAVLLWLFLSNRNGATTIAATAVTSSVTTPAQVTSLNAGVHLPSIHELPLMLKLSRQVSVDAGIEADVEIKKTHSTEGQAATFTAATFAAVKDRVDTSEFDAKKPAVIANSGNKPVANAQSAGDYQENAAPKSKAVEQKLGHVSSATTLANSVAASRTAVQVDHSPPVMIKEVSPQQQAEGHYRQATVYQQQGRAAEAINALQQALVLDAVHAPARQLLISLLLESNRQDEAIRELKQGLIADPQQINFAMILARLQVERAKLSEAIEILQRGLPAAQERPDYLAFLAALYQKTSQHKEAIQLYRLALKRHSQNGVWWMGLGISLQADGLSNEAIDAYKQAKLRSGLSAELQAFIDQKIAQLQK
jgi:MSHA biogenesis protein MshN